MQGDRPGDLLQPAQHRAQARDSQADDPEPEPGVRPHDHQPALGPVSRHHRGEVSVATTITDVVLLTMEDKMMTSRVIELLHCKALL